MWFTVHDHLASSDLLPLIKFEYKLGEHYPLFLRCDCFFNVFFTRVAEVATT